MVEQSKVKHHTDNLSAGFTLHPFVIDSTGNIGPKAYQFIKFFNEISGVKEVNGKGKRKVSGKEVFMRRRILFMCILRGALARENAPFQLKPCRNTMESAKFY